MKHLIESLTPMQKGIAALVLGVFLLLHATNLLVISNFFLIIIGLILVGYGLYATGLLPRIQKAVGPKIQKLIKK